MIGRLHVCVVCNRAELEAVRQDRRSRQHEIAPLSAIKLDSLACVWPSSAAIIAELRGDRGSDDRGRCTSNAELHTFTLHWYIPRPAAAPGVALVHHSAGRCSRSARCSAAGVRLRLLVVWPLMPLEGLVRRLSVFNVVAFVCLSDE